MAINTHLSTTESKKQTKQTRRKETESWTQQVFWWLPDGCGGMGEEVRGLRSTNRDYMVMKRNIIKIVY